MERVWLRGVPGRGEEVMNLLAKFGGKPTDIASDCQEYRIGLLSPYSKKRYDSAQCERFIHEVQRLSKEHNFRILWKESIRRFCRDWSICPDLHNSVLGDSVAETRQ